MHWVQVSLVLSEPPVQVYMVSILQVEEHPSPLAVFVSSHSSLVCLRSSPHIASQASLAGFGVSPPTQRVQVSIEEVVPPAQAYIASIVQVPLQPSPLIRAPSSHSSVACSSPSPQFTTQSDLSPFGEVPRVQAVQTSGVVNPPPVHPNISSITQAEVQPSPSARFPSSHSSLEWRTPSPHWTAHKVLVGFGDSPPVQRVQVSGVVVVPPVQMYMFSMAQAELHPSPLPVSLSSHSSLGCLSPSPHWIAQASLAGLGDSPPVQRVQASKPVVEPPAQAYIVSMAQAELHPSLLTALLSSHSSLGCSSPSPQMVAQAVFPGFGDWPPTQSVHTSFEVVVPPVQAYMASIVQVEEHPSESAVLVSSHTSLGCLRLSPQFTWQVSLAPLGDSPPEQRVQVS